VHDPDKMRSGVEFFSWNRQGRTKNGGVVELDQRLPGWISEDQPELGQEDGPARCRCQGRGSYKEGGSDDDFDMKVLFFQVQRGRQARWKLLFWVWKF